MIRKNNGFSYKPSMLIILSLIIVLIGCSDDEPIVIDTDTPDIETENPDTGSEEPGDLPAVDDINYETKAFTLLTLEKPSYLTSENEVQWEVISSPSELFRISHLQEQTTMFIAAVEGEYVLKVTGGDIEGKVIITVAKPTKQPSPYIAKVFDYMPAPGQIGRAHV